MAVKIKSRSSKIYYISGYTRAITMVFNSSTGLVCIEFNCVY